MSSVIREVFLAEYEFPLEPTRHFELDGCSAEFAAGHPRKWEGEDMVIDFSKNVTNASEISDGILWSALSSDQKLLAIGFSNKCTWIYDVATKELRATLEGSGHLDFRPTQTPAQGYMLMSSICTGHWITPLAPVVLWNLDKNGHLIGEEEPINTNALATKAIEAVLPELVSSHGWTTSFVIRSALHSDIERALTRVATDHRRRNCTMFDQARTSHFSSDRFSSDGKLFWYQTTNLNTENKSPESNDCPKIVRHMIIVYDIETKKTLHHFAGDTNPIFWSAMSPDQKRVASISWNGTLRMYSLESNKLEWALENPGNIFSPGAFTPDSQHIVWNVGISKVVQIHKVSNGQMVVTLDGKLNHPSGQFAWHPAGDLLAFHTTQYVFFWRPFDGRNGAVVQQYIPGKKFADYASEIHSISWMKAGQLLALEFSDGTKLIYNMETNKQEVFLRPKGMASAYIEQGMYGILKDEVGQEFYLSVDGDGKVRYWWRNTANISNSGERSH